MFLTTDKNQFLSDSDIVQAITYYRKKKDPTDNRHLSLDRRNS